MLFRSAGMARLTDRMSRTAVADRQALTALAAGEATPVAPTDVDDDVRMELASRWLPADELDAATPR